MFLNNKGDTYVSIQSEELRVRMNINIFYVLYLLKNIIATSSNQNKGDYP